MAHGAMVSDLARLSGLKVSGVGQMNKPRLAAGMVTQHVEVYVVLKDILDFESESKRLQKEISKLEKEYGNTQKKLSNEDFLGKAPQDVIEKEREKGSRLGEKLEKLRHHYEIVNTLRESAAAGE
jgi:valyl-tRNA synthetase